MEHKSLCSIRTEPFPVRALGHQPKPFTRKGRPNCYAQLEDRAPAPQVRRHQENFSLPGLHPPSFPAISTWEGAGKKCKIVAMYSPAMFLCTALPVDIMIRCDLHQEHDASFPVLDCVSRWSQAISTKPARLDMRKAEREILGRVFGI